MMVQDSKAGARRYFGVNFTFDQCRDNTWAFRLGGPGGTSDKSLLKSDLKKIFKPYRAWL